MHTAVIYMSQSGFTFHALPKLSWGSGCKGGRKSTDNQVLWFSCGSSKRGGSTAGELVKNRTTYQRDQINLLLYTVCVNILSAHGLVRYTILSSLFRYPDDSFSKA